MAHIDYLAYTFKGTNVTKDYFLSKYQDIISVIFPRPLSSHLINHDYVVRPCGAQGFRGHLYYENLGISVLFDSSVENNGIHVKLSGTAMELFDIQDEFLRDFVADMDYTYKILSDVFSINNPIEFKVSRCDIAFDVSIPFSDFLNKFKNGCILTKTKFECNNMVLNKDLTGTMYFGSRTSKCFIRIYDKYLEQKAKFRDIYKPTDVPKTWTRVEFEFKNQSKNPLAHTVFLKAILPDYMTYLSEICSSFLYITEDPVPENYNSTWKRLKMWDKYELILQRDYFVQLSDEYVVNSEYIAKAIDNGLINIDSVPPTSINLRYLEVIYNVLNTAMTNIPGLEDFLKRNFKISKSMEAKSTNFYLDFNTLKSDDDIKDLESVSVFPSAASVLEIDIDSYKSKYSELSLSDPDIPLPDLLDHSYLLSDDVGIFDNLKKSS